MNKILLVVAVFVLSACSPTITGGELQRATERCKDKGGIEQFHAPTFFAIADFTRLFQVKCYNGEIQDVNQR